MSDPFDKLRGTPDVSAPSVDVIRARAHRIARRRYVVAASSAAVVVVLAGVGLFLRPSPKTVQEQGGGVTQALRAAPTATASRVPTSNTSSSAGKSSGTASQPTYVEANPMAPNDGASLSMQSTLTATLKVSGKTFTLSVCNNSSSSASRTFPTTQRYDFRVSRGSTDVWDWSHGQAFGDVVTSETWNAHECKTWSATWNGMTNAGAPAASGMYSVFGVMTSNPKLQTPPQNFCVYVC